MPAPTHSSDFKNVNWYGREYRFSPQQAACIQVLWRQWLSGTPIVRDELVLSIARVKARSLKDVFKSAPGNAAWGTMIADGDRRGTVRLAELAEHDVHAEAATTA
ncbi:MAG: hypothetical protein ACREJM_02915 [Candidatus Saccharimonadales bacterium]